MLVKHEKIIKGVYFALLSSMASITSLPADIHFEIYRHVIGVSRVTCRMVMDYETYRKPSYNGRLKCSCLPEGPALAEFRALRTSCRSLYHSYRADQLRLDLLESKRVMLGSFIRMKVLAMIEDFRDNTERAGLPVTDEGLSVLLEQTEIAPITPELIRKIVRTDHLVSEILYLQFRGMKNRSFYYDCVRVAEEQNDVGEENHVGDEESYISEESEASDEDSTGRYNPEESDSSDESSIDEELNSQLSDEELPILDVDYPKHETEAADNEACLTDDADNENYTTEFKYQYQLPLQFLENRRIEDIERNFPGGRFHPAAVDKMAEALLWRWNYARVKLTPESRPTRNIGIYGFLARLTLKHFPVFTLDGEAVTFMRFETGYWEDVLESRLFSFWLVIFYDWDTYCVLQCGGMNGRGPDDRKSTI